MSVSREDALWAVVTWMGSYEGRSGAMVADMDALGFSDEEMVADEVPEDMVAGYRLAVQEAQAEQARREENEAVDELAGKFPDRRRADLRRAYRATLKRLKEEAGA